MLVLVLGPPGGERVLVAPVTFDVEAADEDAVVVDVGRSPLGAGVVLFPALTAALPRAGLVRRVTTLATATELPGLLAGNGPGSSRGTASRGDTDPRLELRRHLAERLEALEGGAPSPLERTRSTLIEDLRALRGAACSVRALAGWPDLVEADRSGWSPLVTVDEVGVVLSLIHI